jgi:hypothetical protein
MLEKSIDGIRKCRAKSSRQRTFGGKFEKQEIRVKDGKYFGLFLGE